MKNFTKIIILLTLISVSFPDISFSQVKKTPRKAPKFTLSVALNYNYAMSKAYGDVTGFSAIYDSTKGGYIFNANNYGMQQGGGIQAVGKLALGKKRRVKLTLNLGYNLFINSASSGVYETQWHLFSTSAGIEYNFSPKSRFRSFIGYELVYTIMFGSWTTNFNTTTAVSNYKVKFNAAHRFGMAVNSGIEFRLTRRTGLLLGYRAVWANIMPKQNNVSSTPYLCECYINDSKDDNGININFRKQVVYLQVLAGVSVYFYK
ncbi:MAG: hypothetical protein ACRDFC_09195 [Ignavibacteria bacterium]